MQTVTDRGTDAAPALPETARRHRDDGWTREKQRIFLNALAAGATVRAAVRLVGMTLQSAYRLRRDPRARAFAAAWSQALHAAYETLAETALDRAINGVTEPIFYRGEQVGERTRHNDRLLIALLRQYQRPAKGVFFAGSPIETHSIDSRDATALLTDLAADPARFTAADVEMLRNVFCQFDDIAHTEATRNKSIKKLLREKFDAMVADLFGDADADADAKPDVAAAEVPPVSPAAAEPPATDPAAAEVAAASDAGDAAAAAGRDGVPRRTGRAIIAPDTATARRDRLSLWPASAQPNRATRPAAPHGPG